MGENMPAADEARNLPQRGRDPTYPPLNTLKPIAPDVWIVDGPLIRFGLPFLKMPFPTRMTVIRIRGELFIHSPTELGPALRHALDAVGEVRWIVAPNRIHYWWVPQWHMAYPDVPVFLAPRVREQAGAHIDFPSRVLDRTAGYPWDEAIATLPVVGRYMTEVVFFHRPSRTLVLTDFMENFEAAKLTWAQRALVRLGGVLDPNGGMPRDMRLAYSKAVVRDAVNTMIGWNPERIVLAHGRWYGRNAVDELQRAFKWLW